MNEELPVEPWVADRFGAVKSNGQSGPGHPHAIRETAIKLFGIDGDGTSDAAPKCDPTAILGVIAGMSPRMTPFGLSAVENADVPTR